MKKLIFLREGYIKDINATRNILNKLLNINAYSIDEDIIKLGYNNAVTIINSSFYDWYITVCPTILSAHDTKFDPIWFNDKEDKWEIYFIKNGKLKNISEYTDKYLRKVHNIEHLYLNGGLDE